MTEPVEVVVSDRGPYVLRGPVEIHAGLETIHREGPVALCRCGASATKPFCDGSHRRVWADTEDV